ncbi:hypothetical protein BURK2_04494 [Burkholderiales bacterium]|nr:hypothetical protein BURK2_04494 [Burkholderiales bacterium]
MRIEDHLLRFAGIGRHEHLPAVGQPEVRHLDRLHHAAQLDLFMAPIELAGLAGRERQRHKGFDHGGTARPPRLPALHKALNGAVRTTVALGLQALEQALGSPLLALRQAGFDVQPLFQQGQELAQLGHGLALPLIARFRQRRERFAHRRTGKLKTTGNRADALLAHKMMPSDFGYEFHTYHPRLLRQKHRMVTQPRGGKYSMLISPDPW